ncbi:MAG TPA: hydrogen peroxide-inducible genes activator [Caulobacteraceae bacterium]|jgi:LysR family hydrogen peroxide-inducible transcriptional activator|nr:hydrogen peroxide-inducible genes activator [Caulobacteraceae bacterium]
MLPSLRQLQYLKLLSEHGSFSRAAEAAHVSQPALSAGVQELERVLGAPVVERARGGVILTPVGEEAVRRAEDVLARAEDLVEAARGAAKPLAGRFRLGVIPTVAPFVLPRSLPDLKTRYPQLKLYLREDLTPRLIAALKSGALDAAVIALPYDVSGLDYARVGDDEILAATPLDHPLAKAARVEPGALNPDDLILLEDGHCLRDHALSACRLDAPKGEDVFAATSLQTLMQMVSAGLGVSFVPEMAVKAGLGGEGVAIRPLERDAPKREIVVAWRAGSSRKREGELLAEVFRQA